MRFLNVGLMVALWLTTVLYTQSCVGQEIIPGTEYSSIDAIPPAPDGEARGYYEAETGRIYVTIGTPVLVIDFAGGLPSLQYRNANNATPLGAFEHCEPHGFCQISFTGLAPGGPYDLGQLLPANPAIRTADDFVDWFPNSIFRSGAPGAPEVRSRFNVIPVAIPEPGSGAAVFIMLIFGYVSQRI